MVDWKTAEQMYWCGVKQAGPWLIAPVMLMTCTAFHRNNDLWGQEAGYFSARIQLVALFFIHTTDDKTEKWHKSGLVNRNGCEAGGWIRNDQADRFYTWFQTYEKGS